MKKAVQVTNERYRLNYHISTPAGWLNDPNGFSYFKGYYHIFYQYHPYSAEWGPMHWGHCRSKDLVHWEELPIALSPDSEPDCDGCYSGSAIEKDDRLFLIYTGNRYCDNKHEQFCQTQNVAFSEDGVHFKKYDHNPVIESAPVDNSEHFRDPKVWRHNDKFYLVIGSQSKEGLGRVLTYQSNDLYHWQYLGPIAEAINVAEEGYMWECPDLFSLNGKDILLCSPQGIESAGKKYLNCHQTGYFVGQMDYQNNCFEHGCFTELDRGHDFYAAQTMRTPDNRQILFGWMDMWHSNFPEQADGWSGALTLPRELKLKDNRLLMTPVKELIALRQKKEVGQKLAVENEQINVSDAQHVELLLNFSLEKWEGKQIVFTLKESTGNILALTFNSVTNEVVIKRSDKEPNDAKRFGQVNTSDELKLRIFIDTSSVEFFINDGELVFSERYYTKNEPRIVLTADKPVMTQITAYNLSK
ncbi:Sucrose-6-phosphate hydrolase [Lactobacillus apis]|uniref:Sucrose-6-phosphate hydrolase n=2 Tax=Lactobacillus apis TaxID=303541 RepID=A0A0F4LUZ3_9LACO|nr:sucrose-6-phosphate hydrolase [Lactobacillus apis]KJY62109.1 Sucrose-6-phosphate hydrolase [Lactobacillus apis]